MTTVRSLTMLPLVASLLAGQAPDFRKTSWGMNRAEVMAMEGSPPSQVGARGPESVLRYESVPFAGLECRVVYIFAKDKLVRTKYVFQRDHGQKNDFLADFATVDAFLMGTLEHPAGHRVLWRNELYKAEPQHYGEAVSLGQLLYSSQWKDARTVVTHALAGENGVITHEVEYASVELESWEDQITKVEDPTDNPPRALQSAAAP